MPRMEEPEGQGEQINVAELTAEFDPDHAAVGRIRRAVEVTA